MLRVGCETVFLLINHAHVGLHAFKSLIYHLKLFLYHLQEFRKLFFCPIKVLNKKLIKIFQLTLSRIRFQLIEMIVDRN